MNDKDKNFLSRIQLKVAICGCCVSYNHVLKSIGEFYIYLPVDIRLQTQFTGRWFVSGYQGWVIYDIPVYVYISGLSFSGFTWVQ